MITIPAQYKTTLNKLIRYYRTHSNNPSYETKNFIYDENGIRICAISTLSRIMNNKVHCNDDTYFQLCKKLNKPFTLDESLNALLNETNKNLLMNAEVNNADKILSILTKTKHLLEPFSNNIIYSELYELYSILHLYYSTQEFNKQQLDKYIELYDIIPEEVKPIFISIAYHYYSRVNINEIVSLNLISHFQDTKFSNSIICMYLNTIYLARSNQNNLLESAAKKGVSLCKKKENNYYLIRFYNTLAYFYRFSNPELAIHYLTLCIANYKNENDPYSTLSAFYHNMVQLSYDRKKYSSIVYIYKKHLYNDVKFLKVFFYLIIKSIEETDNDKAEIIRILSTLENTADSKDTFHYVVLKVYVCIYNNMPFEETLRMINQLPLFKKDFFNEPLLQIFLFDIIEKTCKSSNNYQIFDKLVNDFH